MTATMLDHPAPVERRAPAAAPGLSASDLAELIASFNDITSKLQGTHEMLRGEVARLETELRETREQLKRAQELAALGEMAAGIAHEVRNPLGSIRLYASMLTQDLADRPAERGVAERIAGAVSRLDAVVGDVLAFSKVMKVREEELSSADLLCDAAAACEELFVKWGIEIRFTKPRRPMLVRGDPVLLHQALTNVMRNAAEAMGERSSPGEPRILWLDAVRRRLLGPAGAREPGAALVIRDTGPGIPPEVLPRIFNPFFTTRHTGTGLGLAIVHRIIDAHGGRVLISNNTEPGPGNTPARGATVELLLPTKAAGEHTEQREAA